MEILDKDLREYFRGLSDVDLKEFMDNSYAIALRNDVHFKRYNIDSVGQLLIDSEDLKKIADDIKMKKENPLFKGFDNESANPTQDELELRDIFETELSRKIPQYELSILAEQVFRERKGEKFAQLPLETMGKIVSGKHEKAEQAEKNAGDVYGVVEFQKVLQTPSEYGLDYWEMKDILDYAKSRETISELVKGIPKNELQQKKEMFEKNRNSPAIRYSSREKEMRDTLKMLFGDIEDLDGFFMKKMPMVEIEDAFEERLKEIEKGKNKEGKGLFSRIKDWFSRRGQKALPEGQETETIQMDNGQNVEINKKSKDNAFKKSMYVSPEKRNENVKGTSAKGKKKEQQNVKSIGDR